MDLVSAVRFSRSCHTMQDAGIPSGAILEITSYLKRLNKPHQIGQCSSGYPSAQQPYQMLSSMATNAYVMDMTRQNYLPSHAVSHCHVAQQQRNMLVDSRHVCNNPRMESQPVSPASPFPVVASPLSTNPLGSQMDHHQLQCQPQLHLQIGCRSTTNSSQEVLGTGRSLGLSTTGEYGVVHTAPTMSQGVGKDYYKHGDCMCEGKDMCCLSLRQSSVCGFIKWRGTWGKEPSMPFIHFGKAHILLIS